MTSNLPRAILGIVVCVAGLTGCTGEAKVTVAEVRAEAIEAALKKQKGKVVVVDCWATWCAPCVKAFPHLIELHKKYVDKGLVCMSVSMDKLGDPDAYKEEKVLRFLQGKGAAFPNFIVAEPEKDEKALNKILGDSTLIPYMAIFDRTGRRIWTSDEKPALSEAQLDKKIESILAD